MNDVCSVEPGFKSAQGVYAKRECNWPLAAPNTVSVFRPGLAVTALVDIRPGAKFKTLVRSAIGQTSYP